MARPMAASPPTTSSPTPVVPPPAEPATTPAVKPPTPLDEDDGDDGATMVSRVPDELIKQSATGAFPAAVSDEEAHFQDVYKQFVATKQQCGEPTAGLSFERFKETLHKNQEKIRQAHGTSKVRFTVYVKEGRAALKATPIK